MKNKRKSGLHAPSTDVLRVLLEKRREFELELISFEAGAAKYVSDLKRSLEFFDNAIRRAEEVSTDVHTGRNTRPQIASESWDTSVGVFNVPRRDMFQEVVFGDGEQKKRENQTQHVLDFMGSLMDELNHPVSKPILMERLAASGYQLNVTDPKKFVQKALWRSKQFEYLEDKDGWWKKGVPVPDRI